MHGVTRAIDTINKEYWQDFLDILVVAACCLVFIIISGKEESLLKQNLSTLSNIPRHHKIRQIHKYSYSKILQTRKYTFLLLYYYLFTMSKISLSFNMYITHLLYCHIYSTWFMNINTNGSELDTEMLSS